MGRESSGGTNSIHSPFPVQAISTPDPAIVADYATIVKSGFAPSFLSSAENGVLRVIVDISKQIFLNLRELATAKQWASDRMWLRILMANC